MNPLSTNCPCRSIGTPPTCRGKGQPPRPPDPRLPLEQRDLIRHLGVLLDHSEYRGNRSQMLRAARTRGLPDIPVGPTLSKHLGGRAARHRPQGPDWKTCHLFVLLCSPPAHYTTVRTHFAVLWRAAHGSWPDGYTPQSPLAGDQPPADTSPVLVSADTTQIRRMIDTEEHRLLTMALVHGAAQKEAQNEAVNHSLAAVNRALRRVLESMSSDLSSREDDVRRLSMAIEDQQRVIAELSARSDTYYASSHPPVVAEEPWQGWIPPSCAVSPPSGGTARRRVPPGIAGPLDRRGPGERITFLLAENQRLRRQIGDNQHRISENQQEIRQLRAQQARDTSRPVEPVLDGLLPPAEAIGPPLTPDDPRLPGQHSPN